jgi:ferredoxin
VRGYALKLQTLRRTSQAAFLAVTLTGIIIGTTGIVYPYFFCYSNPWDVGNCPLGLLEHGAVDIQNMFWTGVALLLYVAGFLALMAVIFGRAFCGWACPIGALQDIANKLKISDKVRKKLRPNVHPRWKNVKYLMLLAVPVTAYFARDLFYTNLCPIGGITGTLPTMLFYSSEWAFGSSFIVKLTSMILFSALIILVVRGWCKYLCPIGAFLAPWNKVSAVGLRRNEDTCKHCNLCEKKCPMDIKDMGVKPESECILCGRCVDSCKFGSLKLGAQPFNGRKAMAIWTVLLFLSASMLAGGVWLDGYNRANDINSLPCLGCLALDPDIAAEWLFTFEAQPDFILEPLASKPVFLHYRTDVCPGCDEMEPHIAILEAQYGEQVEFIHINLDHATAEEDATYDVYDFAGTPNARFGVPMFSTVIVEMDESEPVISYMTQYGSSADQGASKRLELEETILEALERHSAGAAPIVPSDPSDAIVLSELYVDMGCVNCYKSEHALEELEAVGETNFITFITDAPGVSGEYATYREDAYVDDLAIPVLGHPLVVFAGGPGNRLGAVSTEAAIATYRTEIAAATLSDVELSISGYMSKSGDTLFSNITLTNLERTSESIRVEAFLVERLSQWKNLQGQPIPNAFIDLVANESVSIPANGTSVLPIEWTGTDAIQLSDLRMGNLGMLVVAWDGDVQITGRWIEPSEPDALFMASDFAGVRATLPNGTAEFGFTLMNYLATGVEVSLAAEKPANWDMDMSASSIYIQANGVATFTVTFTGNGTSAGELYNFTVRATGISDATIQASSRVQVAVKDDMTAPAIGTPQHSPTLPGAEELITITVDVTDASGIDSVKLSYFSCTPVACSPYYVVEMNLTTGNTYSASVHPVADDHTDFHYRIIAQDSEGNTLATDLHDIELEPVETQTVDATARPKWMGAVVLVIIAIIAIIIALTSREKPKQKEPAEEVPPKAKF